MFLEEFDSIVGILDSLGLVLVKSVAILLLSSFQFIAEVTDDLQELLILVLELRDGTEQNEIVRITAWTLSAGATICSSMLSAGRVGS